MSRCKNSALLSVSRCAPCDGAWFAWLWVSTGKETKHSLFGWLSGEHNAQRRGPATLAAQVLGTCGWLSLATGLLRSSVSKVALSRDIDRRTVYRIFQQKPAFKPRNRIFRDAFRHWNLLWMSGICSWLFAAKAENNQLRGISGLVSRLYLGFYIPMRIDRTYLFAWQKNMWRI